MFKPITILVSLYLIASNALWGQYVNVPQTTLFQSKFINPVSIKVFTNEQGRIKFQAENKTYYPFLVTVDFITCKNVIPEIYTPQHYIVNNGIKELLTFTVVGPPEYRYRWSYSVGDYRLLPDSTYPYLFPLKTGRILQVNPKASRNNPRAANYFKVQQSDTVYAMRKGMVVARPNMDLQHFRISKENSIEVYHSDGTVMVYRNIEADSCFVIEGRKVYPGQPLGISNRGVQVSLYRIHGKGKADNLPIHYALDEHQTEKYDKAFNGTKVYKPLNIIQKEMTKREIKKYSKGKLIEE